MITANNHQTTTHLSFDLPLPIDHNYLKEALAAILYYNGILSEKQAHALIGKTRREFQEEIIPKFGLSMIGGTENDAEIELAACKR